MLLSVWLSHGELMRLPTRGAAWESLVATAAESTGTPDLADPVNDADVRTLAKALVGVRLGNEAYLNEVRTNVTAAMGTEAGGINPLALGRNLAPYVISADLVGLAPEQDTQFRTWLGQVIHTDFGGRSLVETHEERPNNWGTMAGASRAAVAAYLGDTADLARTAQVFKGWLGDRNSYAGFTYGDDLSWHADPANPVGINPADASKDGHSIDGAQPEEMRRGGPFQWPPLETGYGWEALQGAAVQAEILYRGGFDAWQWQDQALLRAYRFLEGIGWPAEGDDEWIPWLFDARYSMDLADGSGSVDFGAAQLGESVDKRITVKNTGTAPLTLGTTIVVPAGFSVVSGFEVTELGAGQSTSFTLRFQAAGEGTYTGRVSFSSNDSDEQLFDFAVTGIALPAPAEQIVDDGNDDYHDSGSGWLVAEAGYGDDVHYVAAPDGTHTADWEFTLAPGEYEVFVTWAPHMRTGASNAPYTVYDGSTLAGVRLIDQRIDPDDIYHDGYDWEGLGTYQVQSGQLRVRLTDQGADGEIIADAVYVRSTASQPAPVQQSAGGALAANAVPQSVESGELSGPEIVVGLNFASNPVARSGKIMGWTSWTHAAPAINRAPVVDAGSDRVLMAPSVIALDGSVVDDGLPYPPGTVTTTWARATGPGVVTFGDSSAADTTASFSSPGIYELLLTANDGEFSVSDQITVTVNDPSTPITVSFQDGVSPVASYAGTRDATISSSEPASHLGGENGLDVDGSPDKATLLKWDLLDIPAGSEVQAATITVYVTGRTSDTYEIYAAARDWDETTVSWLESAAGVAWQVPGAQGVSDRDSVIIGTLSAANTGLNTYILNAAGLALVQQWIDDPASNRGIMIQDYVASNGMDFHARESATAANRPKLNVTVVVDPANQAPFVSAGEDLIALPGAPVLLDATVSDDGRPVPPGGVTTAWSKVSGPGLVAFAGAAAVDTTATFSSAGTYVLRLDAYDGQFTTSDTVTVNVHASNQVPVVHAGADQSVLRSDVVLLEGSASDDGLPGPLTTAWTQVSGPGPVTFADAASPVTTATFSVAGVYVLRLRADDGSLAAEDEVTITVSDISQTITHSFQDGVFPDSSYTGTWDTKIYVSNPTNNYGANDNMDVDGSPQEAALLRWDLSSIPPGALVHSVSIGLDVIGTSKDAYEFYELRRPWREREATWNLSSAGSPWQVAGANGTADRGNAVLGAITSSVLGWTTIELNAAGIAVVQSWIDRPETNHGLVIQDYLSASDKIEFRTSEASTPTLRPRIDIVVINGGTVPNQAPVVHAGEDQTILVSGAATLDGTVTDDGLPNPPGAVATLWSTVSGPGTVTFANSSLVDTTATFNAAGTYVLRLTANDGQQTVSDDVVVNVQSAQPANQAPVVDTGLAQTIFLWQSATLDGTVNDDGLPNPPGSVTTLWSKASGPGVVNFANAAAIDTTATFTSAGVYVLRLEAYDGDRLGYDEVTITVQAGNQAPTVGAGPDQTIVVTSAAILDGTVSDDGLPDPPGAVTTLWTMASGPGTVTFADAAAVDTTATFSMPGTYVLQLRASDGQYTSIGQTTITVRPVNSPPAVNAGPDQSILISGPAILDGTVTDDGLPTPPGSITSGWTKASGPGVVTFGNSSAIDTTATFSMAGTYVLRLTAFDGEFTVFDEATVVVDPVNQPPVVHAGSDQSVAITDAATLDGTVIDDGLPVSPGAVTTTWSKLSGPGTVTFGSPSAIDTTATFSMAGLYTLRLTASDGQLSQADDVAITVTDPSASTTVSFQDGVAPDSLYKGARDTKLRSDNPTTIYGSRDKLELDGKPDFTSLIRWDLSSIPPGSTIVSVAITLYVAEESLASFELYELKRPWIEAEATFQRATIVQPWEIAGASGATDRGSTVLGAVSAPALGPRTIELNAAGLAVVQSWIADPAKNFGFVIQDYDDASTDDLDFYSRESRTILQRPRLTITYIAGTAPSSMLSAVAATDLAMELLYAPQGQHWTPVGAPTAPAGSYESAPLLQKAATASTDSTISSGSNLLLFPASGTKASAMISSRASVSQVEGTSDEVSIQHTSRLSDELLAEIVGSPADTGKPFLNDE